MTQDNGTEIARNAHFTEDEKTQGLIALALCSGNGRRARRYLERNAVGMERLPSARTLARWHGEYQDRYLEIQQEVLPLAISPDAVEHARRGLATHAIHLFGSWLDTR